MADWVWVAVSVLGSLAGGFIGGWTVAFRMGQWRQETEGRLAAVEATQIDLKGIADANREARITTAERLRELNERLDRGGESIDDVPVLAVQIKALTETLSQFQRTFSEALKDLVTRMECERRHEHDRRQ